jgi:phosphatidate cytidylyltransferase
MTWTRVLTALVLMPVAIAIVLFAPTWGVAIALAVLTVLALWEYFALGEAIGHRAYRLWTCFCALALIFHQLLDVFNYRYIEPRGATTVSIGSHAVLYPPSISWPLFLFVVGTTVITLFTRRPLVETLPAAGISSSALLLVAFPLSFAVRLHGITEGPRLLLFALVITWAADTFAYFAGRAFGKHPLAPHISPKKTWEGSIAGLVGSLAVAYAFHFWLTIPLVHLFAMAVLGNVAGQMGDLLESAYKRSAGVKDSGGLLPGHGGILDRIDAMILCVPVIWYYLVVVNPGG